MAGTAAFIWFVVTTFVVFGVVALGTYLAIHSYDRQRGVVHFHLWHRHG
jgi:hypothetical protein